MVLTIHLIYSKAGTYTIYFRIEADMRETTYGSITFTITPLEPKIQVVDETHIYDGNPVKLNYTVDASLIPTMFSTSFTSVATVCG